MTTGERLEVLDPRPDAAVAEAEYRRLLGYPPGHVPDARVRELEGWARRWYAGHGRPWIYWREVELELADGVLRLDGSEFPSTGLRDHLVRTGALRAIVAAVGAGRECEEHARVLWQDGRPDEYFFLEIYGSAVVEHLVASLNSRLCALAEREGLAAIPHFSPGYTGWDVADQGALFDCVMRGASRPLPESLEVLSSGMLRPKKSQLLVVGLAARDAPAARAGGAAPCTSCAFSPCSYRRAPYRHVAADPTELMPAPARPPARERGAAYTVPTRALQKWSQERVRLERCADGSIEAVFRFDGSTCSNMGRPLAFEYALTLGAPADGYAIRRAGCRPAPDDDGHTFMCACLNDPAGLLRALEFDLPPLGRPLGEVLFSTRPAASSGCLCSPTDRAHKWRLALEAVHYALAHSLGP